MALIKPMVYAPLVREKFQGKVKLVPLATDLGYLSNTTVGETVTFPKFKAITDATEITKGTEMEVESLDQTSSTATIKQIGKAIRVFDMDNLTALGNQIEEAATQQAVVFARKLDKDLAKEALTSPLKSPTAAAKAITATEVNNALGMYGDDADVEDFAGIVIHSLLQTSFIAMPEFTSVEKTYTNAGNGIVRGGMIGYFRGIPVYMADHVTYDATTQECITFIIKKNSLGVMTKRDINIEEERMPKLKASDIAGDFIYAVKLIADDGVVVVRKTIV